MVGGRREDTGRGDERLKGRGLERVSRASAFGPAEPFGKYHHETPGRRVTGPGKSREEAQDLVGAVDVLLVGNGDRRVAVGMGMVTSRGAAL